MRLWGDLFRVRTAMGEVLAGIVRHFDPAGYCCLEFPERQGAMLSIFCEKAREGAMLTITWLLYEAAAVRDRWAGLADRSFGQPAAFNLVS